MAESTDPNREEPPQFSQLLFAQRGGALHGELTDELAALVEAVMATGKAGSLTLTIKVAKAGKGGGHQMVVTDVVSIKAPKSDRGETFFFFDERNSGLSRNDPLQPSLPLQEVPKPDTRSLKEA